MLLILYLETEKSPAAVAKQRIEKDLLVSKVTNILHFKCIWPHC